MFFISGLKRSGSTWSYNVARIFLESVSREEKIFMGYVGEGRDVDEFLAREAGSFKTSLLKFHVPTPRIFNLVAKGVARNIFTFRCPLEALASEIDFFKLPFNQALMNILNGLHSMEIWRRQPGTLIVKHEDITSNPVREIKRIANHFEISAHDSIIQYCANETSYENIKRKAELLANESPEKLTRAGAYTYDPVTLLHIGHVRNNSSRDWRSVLQKEQIEIAIESLKSWLPEDFDPNR